MTTEQYLPRKTINTDMSSYSCFAVDVNWSEPQSQSSLCWDEMIVPIVQLCSDKALLFLLSDKKENCCHKVFWSLLWFLSFLAKVTLKLVSFVKLGNAELSIKCQNTPWTDC